MYLPNGTQHAVPHDTNGIDVEGIPSHYFFEYKVTLPRYDYGFGPSA